MCGKQDEPAVPVDGLKCVYLLNSWFILPWHTLSLLVTQSGGNCTGGGDMTLTRSTAPAVSEREGRGGNDRIDPSRAAAGVKRWRRALAAAEGEDPGARLDRPDRRLTMLRIFGSTRRLADLCIKYPSAAAMALVEGASAVLAEAARDLSSLSGGVGGADALYGALSPIKCRSDLAIGIAEISGAWSASEAAAARADIAERLVETALSWLVRGARSRGELAGVKDEAPSAHVFAVAGGDFAHEDLAPYGPLELTVIYDETAFAGPAARMAERAFVRIGAELREAFEGKPGDYPLFSLKTPFGSAVGGAGLTESKGRVLAAIKDEQRGALRAWLATARIVAGDRRVGGGFLEEIEERVWQGVKPFEKDMSSTIAATGDDPRTSFRHIADAFRFAFGASRPIFRTASSREVIETAAKSAAIPQDVARRLIAGDEFVRNLVSRAQMMKGAAAFGAAQSDEEPALASLCGFRGYELMATALAGVLADAENAFLRLRDGPFAEYERYKPAERADDVEKLEDLGFSRGSDLSGTVDRWADIAASTAGNVRFSAIAPGLLTDIGETQNPDAAARLFDQVLRVVPNKEAAVAAIAADGGVRAGLVDALGCFGAAAAALTKTAELAQEFFEERGRETPENGKEWISRFAPPSKAGAVEDIAAWRCENIARIALYTAARDISFDAAADALNAVSEVALGEIFAAVQRETKAGDKLALHVFDGPARGLPGTANFFGLIATGGEQEPNEEFARRFLEALDQAGDGYFGLAPDVSHRPGGVAGGLAPSVAAFKSYVQSEAVAYDQILLARARVIAGSPEAQKAARAALRTGVSNPKRSDILFRDLDRARAQRLRRDKAASEWDLEQSEGGLHDVELIISTLIYRNAAAQPAIQNGDVGAALDCLSRANLLAPEVAESLKSARAFWTRLATARALARWSDPHREPVRRRFAALLARAAEVERFSQVRPLMRGYADETGRLYAQLVLGRPSLSLVASA